MIDLHTHTNHSDGTDSVEKLLKKAEERNLEIISITDHDSIGAYLELEAKPNLRKIFSGSIITGVELRAVYQKTNIEILGYGIDYHKLHIKKINLFQIQQDTLAYFKEVAQKIGVKYEEEISVKKDDPTCRFASATFARSVLKYKENQKIFEEMGLPFEEESFYRVHESNPKSPFYCENIQYYPSLEEVVDDIHKAGGLAFLAHGYLYPFTNKAKTIEEILATTKIDGAECEYPEFTEEERRQIKILCQKYHKLQSGGSDYHAKNKPHIEMGSGIQNNLVIPVSLVETWKDCVTKI